MPERMNFLTLVTSMHQWDHRAPIRIPASNSTTVRSQVSQSIGNLSLSGIECLLDEQTANGNERQVLDNGHLFVTLSTPWYRFLALITTVGLLVSIVSNVIIIYLFIRNPSNIIAANLSISDLLYCIQWPSVIYCCLTESTWILEYDFVCKSLGFLTVSTALVSIATVLVMAVERAIVIRYSLRAKSIITIKTAWILVLLIWILGLTSCLPPLFGKFNRFTLDPSKTSCTLDYLTSHSDYKLYILVLYIAYYVLPVIAISISYTVIIITFNKSSFNLKVAGLDEGPQSACEFGETIERGQLVHRRASFFCAKLQPSLRRLSALATEASTTRKESITCKSPRSPPLLYPQFSHTAQLVVASKRFPMENKHRKRRVSVSVIIGPEELGISSALNPNIYHSSSSLLSSSQLSSASHKLPCNSSRCIFGEANKQTSFQRARFFSSPWNGNQVDSISNEPASEMRGKEESTNSGQSITTRQPRKFRRTRSNVNRTPRKPDSRDPGASGALPVYYDDLKLASQAAAAATGTAGATALQQQQQQKQQRPRQQHEPPPAGGITNCNTQAEKSNKARNALQLRLAKMSFYLILLWLVSWSPIAWLAMLNSIEKCRRASASAVFLAHTMTKLGPAFDVFIYGLSHPKLKSKFGLIIKRMFGF